MVHSFNIIAIYYTQSNLIKLFKFHLTLSPFLQSLIYILEKNIFIRKITFLGSK